MKRTGFAGRSDKEEAQFTVDFSGKQWTGYCSLVAGLAKAVEAGIPVYEPSFYTNIDKHKLEALLKSETHVPIPLLEKRVECLHEAAAVVNTVRS